MDAPQRLVDYVRRDYPCVLEEYASLRRQLYFPFEFSTVKPFTMVNLYVANEMGIARDKRIACAALVDLTGRALTYVDDKIDGSRSELERGRLSGKQWGSIYGMLLQAANCLIDSHVSEGIITFQESSDLRRTFYRHAHIMDQGSTWQRDHPLSRPFWTNRDVPSLRSVIRYYVDKIAGDLFAWSVEALGYYSREDENFVRQLIAPMRSFARIFQTSDDIVDVVEDAQNKQITTATATAMSTPDEAVKLEAIAGFARNTKFDKSRYASKLPFSYSQLDQGIYRLEYQVLECDTNLSKLRITSKDVALIDTHYRELRERMKCKIPNPPD